MSSPSSSSSSPLTSTAMHWATCSLKWMCFRSPLGEPIPDDLVDGNRLVPSWLSPREENGNVTKSVVARSRPGRLPILLKPSFCCACTAVAACFTSDEVDSDLWSMISDMLLFFKMGFLLMKEFDLDSLALFELVDVWFKLDVPVCSGP